MRALFLLLLIPSIALAQAKPRAGGGSGITIGTPNGLSLSLGVLSLGLADATHAGAVSTDVQTFAGAKTFTGAISASNLSGTNTGDATIATFGSSPANSGATISGQAITMQPADATHPGEVTTGTQSFAGAKTFTGAVAASNLSGTNTGDVSLGAFGAAPASTGATLAGQVLTLQPADTSNPGEVTTGVQSFAGAKTFTGAIAASNLSGSNTGDATIATFGSSPTANAATISGQAITLQPADASNPGLITTGTQSIAGAKTFTGTISASNLSGTNTGNATIATFGSSPTANGASISGQAITLQPADGSNPGAITAGSQTIGGAKTFSSTIGASNLSGTNTGDVTLGTFGAVPDAKGLTISGQAVTLQPADGSNPGAITSGTQTIGGAKTFNGAITASNLSGTNTGDVTIATFGSAPAANAATVSGQAVTIQPADGTHPGAITSGTQTIGGAKTFSSTIGASNLSGTNTGDITLGAVGSSPDANGATLSAQVLTLQPEDSTHPGVVTNAAQTFSGSKSFSSTVLPSSDNAVALGSTSLRWNDVFALNWKDSAGTVRFQTPASNAVFVVSTQANGATAEGLDVNTSATLSTAGALLLKLKNNSTAKFTVDLDGSVRSTPTSTLLTCATALEGSVTTVVAASSHQTKRCMCTSDGVAGLVFYWKNVTTTYSLDSSSNGTTTTCPD